MDAKRWVLRPEYTRQEQWLMKRLVRTGKLFGFLRKGAPVNKRNDKATRRRSGWFVSYFVCPLYIKECDFARQAPQSDSEAPDASAASG